MSRSIIKDKYIRDKYSDESRNTHRKDEMPKNRPSKYITQRCANVEWLQEPGSYGGHKPHTNGHRMASGIIRAKVKEEIRKEIDEE